MYMYIIYKRPLHLQAFIYKLLFETNDDSGFPVCLFFLQLIFTLLA